LRSFAVLRRDFALRELMKLRGRLRQSQDDTTPGTRYATTTREAQSTDNRQRAKRNNRSATMESNETPTH
jgi:hypothetical protein